MDRLVAMLVSPLLMRQGNCLHVLQGPMGISAVAGDYSVTDTAKKPCRTEEAPGLQVESCKPGESYKRLTKDALGYGPLHCCRPSCPLCLQCVSAKGCPKGVTALAATRVEPVTAWNRGKVQGGGLAGQPSRGPAALGLPGSRAAHSSRCGRRHTWPCEEHTPGIQLCSGHLQVPDSTDLKHAKSGGGWPGPLLWLKVPLWGAFAQAPRTGAGCQGCARSGGGRCPGQSTGRCGAAWSALPRTVQHGPHLACSSGSLCCASTAFAGGGS